MLSQAAPGGWAGGALLAGRKNPSLIAALWRVGHPETLLLSFPRRGSCRRARQLSTAAFLSGLDCADTACFDERSGLGAFRSCLPLFIAAARPGRVRSLGVYLAASGILLSINTVRQVLTMWVAGLIVTGASHCKQDADLRSVARVLIHAAVFRKSEFFLRRSKRSGRFIPITRGWAKLLARHPG
ncbi:MAG: hypothetical protein U0787_17235 [Polyangia bacterium]